MPRMLLLLFALMAGTAVPISARSSAPPDKLTHGDAVIPDFSGTWQHPAFPWFEPPASGPGPITNLSRWAEQRPGGLAGSEALPPGNSGISDYDQLVGDYNSAILQPWAAAVVKEYGEISRAGITYGNPSNQCWPSGLPFVFKEFEIALIQQPDRITILYNGYDHEVRRVRMNAQHPSPLTPSWYGDSVGHYEGDTLVVDTVGIRTNRPYGMIDLFGTPFTESLHIIERYRLRDYDEVKGAIDRNAKENWLFNGDVWSQHRGKFLQAEVTIEDQGVFTTPWRATMTYVPAAEFPESVCAENQNEYYNNRQSDVPKAAKPDF